MPLRILEILPHAIANNIVTGMPFKTLAASLFTWTSVEVVQATQIADPIVALPEWMIIALAYIKVFTICVGALSGVLVLIYTALNTYVLLRDKIIGGEKGPGD